MNNYYIFTTDKTNINIFNNLNHKYYFVSNYEIPIIKGVVTENIFNGLLNTPLKVISVSKNVENKNNVYGIIIKPNKEKLQTDYETFIMLNFYNKEYIKLILNITNYYDIFDKTKISLLKNTFNQKKTEFLNNKNDILQIDANYNNFINKGLPFKYIILNTSDIPMFIDKLNNSNKTNNVDNLSWENPKINITYDSFDNTFNNINYIVSEIHYGFGDFIQRYQRLFSYLSYSNNNFILINNEKYSYCNKSHNNAKYFGMYNCPIYDFAIKNNNINQENLLHINYDMLIELIIYNNSFFNDIDNKLYLYINLSSTPGQGVNAYDYHRFNYCARDNASNLICNQSKLPRKRYLIPYSKYDFNFKKFTDNEIVIMHFRRGDYAAGLLNHNRIIQGRSVNTFKNILEILSQKLKKLNIQKIDAVIISDHYDFNKIPSNYTKYIPVLFDYNYVNINSVFKKNDVTITIKDKLIGENDASIEYNTLKYLANSNYIIGNYSCFPHQISKTFNNKLIDLTGGIIANIKNISCLEKLLINKDYYIPE